MQAPYGEAVATRTGLEPWRCGGDAVTQASAEDRAGWVWSSEISIRGHCQRETRASANEIDTDDDHTDGPDDAVFDTYWYNPWAGPAYDAAGNMTSGPKPGSVVDGQSRRWLVYDAWNRLVKVQDASSNVVGVYEYDGLNRRIVAGIDTASPASPDGTLDSYRHFFYAGWQLVETRATDNGGDFDWSLDPEYQYVWSARYIDAAVLRDENLNGDGGYIDNLTVETPAGGGNYVTELVETFDVNAADRAADRPTYDAAGNLTYDGLFAYDYDAWGRLVRVSYAYPDTDSDGDPEIGSVVGRMHYDVLGRRICKMITNCGDYDGTQHYYYNGQQVIETRDGSDNLEKQYVWGLTYVDELVQIRIPHHAAHVRDYYACQDANYNVIGLLDDEGTLIERYEYTPYGQRTIYGHDVFLADFNDDGVVDGTDQSILLGNFGQGSGMTFADGDVDGDGDVDMEDWGQMKIDYGRGAASNDPLVQMPRLSSFRRNRIGPGLCDIGHQGLMHDREFGLLYNRARYLGPRLGRFLSPDPMQYMDGMSPYEFVLSNPTNLLDPFGLAAYKLGTGDPTVTPDPGAGTHGSFRDWRASYVAMGIRLILRAFGNWPDARAHLAHYLDNTGTTYTIRLQNMIHDVPSAQHLYDRELREAKTFVEGLDEGVFDITSGSASTGRNRKIESKNWYYAVGGYAAWGKGEAKVSCDANGVRTYELKFRYKFFDRYNWDNGKFVTINVPLAPWPLKKTYRIPDSFMGDLHRTGVAKEFDMIGTVVKTVTWPSDGSTPSSPTSRPSAR